MTDAEYDEKRTKTSSVRLEKEGVFSRPLPRGEKGKPKGKSVSEFEEELIVLYLRQGVLLTFKKERTNPTNLRRKSELGGSGRIASTVFSLTLSHILL